MTDLFEMALLAGIRKEEKCKGIFFRGRRTTFRTRTGTIYLSEQVKLVFLKRISCPGCGGCGGFWEWFDESIGCYDFDFSTIEDGKIYSPRFVEDGRDWESGYVDDWHYEFDEVK